MNILVLTSIYPEPDDDKYSGITPVVKNFCKEWIKKGHKVYVIHNSNYYPKLFYLLPNKILKKINSILGIVIPRPEQRYFLKTEEKGIVSYRLPMLKIFPRHISSEKQIEAQYKKIEDILNTNSFTPDVILGHWENPQIQLLAKMSVFLNVKTSLVFHGLSYINQKRYVDDLRKLIKKIDYVGARSKTIANDVHSILNLREKPFMCYSGVADQYFKDNETISNLIEYKPKNSYLFVGRLIKRKNVESIMFALDEIYGNEDYNLDIIGDGGENKHLTVIANSLNAKKNIKFRGQKKHDEVIRLMGHTEVFIMISKNETFGLVYIEAMSQGCIVIASKNSGMDGVIKNGLNGYLCEQGNKDELVKICKKIRKMSKKEKTELALNAVKTAKKYSESNVAKNYINNLMQ